MTSAPHQEKIISASVTLLFKNSANGDIQGNYTLVVRLEFTPNNTLVTSCIRVFIHNVNFNESRIYPMPSKIGQIFNFRRKLRKFQNFLGSNFSRSRVWILKITSRYFWSYFDLIWLMFDSRFRMILPSESGWTGNSIFFFQNFPKFEIFSTLPKIFNSSITSRFKNKNTQFEIIFFQPFRLLRITYRNISTRWTSSKVDVRTGGRSPSAEACW